MTICGRAAPFLLIKSLLASKVQTKFGAFSRIEGRSEKQSTAEVTDGSGESLEDFLLDILQIGIDFIDLLDVTLDTV